MATGTPSVRSLLHTKLRPPTQHPNQVPRAAVLDKFHASAHARLFLVQAPAGFGKTTVLAQCFTRFQDEGIATAWLTLDEADNDISRLLSYLAATVDDLTQDMYEQPLDYDALPPGESAFNIVSRLAHEEGAFALFLDEFERVKDPAAVGLIRQILDNLPRRGQLVIASRTLPALGLGRLRARGQLEEIDASQLRFTMAETTDFLSCRRKLSLSQENLASVQQKTEGWAAALWLASLALEHHTAPTEFIARFSGANDTVANYLAEDVLARQPARLRGFLLRTSILRYLDVEICEALFPGIGSSELLHKLDVGNIFLMPIEGEVRTYRYHSLFADFLRSRLALEMPEELPRLHQAASNWYESQQRPIPAIDHALESGDVSRSVQLLLKHARTLLSQGRMRLLARWFDSLPPEHLEDRPILQIIKVWALCFTRGPHEAQAVLVETGLENSSDPQIRPHVMAIRPLLLATMDRFEEAYSSGREALSELPCGDPFVGAVLVNAMARTCAVMGSHAQARELLDEARNAEGSSSFNKMYSEAVEGTIDLHQGRQKQAAARFRLAVGATTRPASTVSHTNGNAWAGVLHALCVYEGNRLSHAAQLLQVYVPLARDVGLPDHMILGEVILSRIAFSDGDVDQVFHILAGLEHEGHARKLPRVVASARLERARVLTLQGHGEAAKAELDRAGDSRLWERVERLRLMANDLEYMTLARLRWEVLMGDPEGAIAPLEHEISNAIAASRYRRALKLRLLLGIALWRSGQAGLASSTLKELLELTCSGGFIRLIVDEGPIAGALIKRFYAQMQEGALEHSNPILAEYIQSLLEAFGPNIAELPTTSEKREPLLEPLTPKEVRVLKLLGEGYSNSALAEKLFVSDSTVRTHLRNINAKLNTRSRTQALVVARRIGAV